MRASKFEYSAYAELAMSKLHSALTWICGKEAGESSILRKGRASFFLALIGINYFLCFVSAGYAETQLNAVISNRMPNWMWVLCSTVHESGVWMAISFEAAVFSGAAMLANIIWAKKKSIPAVLFGALCMGLLIFAIPIVEYGSFGFATGFGPSAGASMAIDAHKILLVASKILWITQTITIYFSIQTAGALMLYFACFSVKNQRALASSEKISSLRQ